MVLFIWDTIKWQILYITYWITCFKYKRIVVVLILYCSNVFLEGTIFLLVYRTLLKQLLKNACEYYSYGYTLLEIK